MTPSHEPVERVVELPATAAAAGLARRELTGVPGVSGALGYKVLLLTSELVALAVQEPDPGERPTLWLCVASDAQRVRVEVAGHPPDEPVRRTLASEETPSLGGYGLRIVDRMADRWGIEGAAGTTIWFEVDR